MGPAAIFFFEQSSSSVQQQEPRPQNILSSQFLPERFQALSNVCKYEWMGRYQSREAKNKKPPLRLSPSRTALTHLSIWLRLILVPQTCTSLFPSVHYWLKVYHLWAYIRFSCTADTPLFLWGCTFYTLLWLKGEILHRFTPTKVITYTSASTLCQQILLIYNSIIFACYEGSILKCNFI